MHPNKAAFSEALQLTLASWSSLKWALEYHSSDPNKPTMSDLHLSLLEYFSVYGSSLDELELADILSQDIMLKEYALILEDDSDLQVAKVLVKVYQECVRGERTELMKLRERGLFKNSSKENSILVDKVLEDDEPESEVGEEEIEMEE